MTQAQALPPCGIYKTTDEVAGVPAGRLVFFHNHGDPGPGVYLPEGWDTNRAQFSERGSTLEVQGQAAALAPLKAEGLYRVRETFHCCDQHCRSFAPGLLVQLGYDGGATPILFVPEWTKGGLSFPEMGQKVDEGRLALLDPLTVATAAPAEASTKPMAEGFLH